MFKPGLRRRHCAGSIAGTLLALALGLTNGPAGAQFVQYTPAGSFEKRQESIDALLDQAMKRSRWRLGNLFADPWIGLRDVSYVEGVESVGGSDFTATVGAGLRLYRPLASEFTLAVHALPEVVWWQDLDDRRRLNGRYGLGVFGNLGRTGLEITATRVEEARFFSRQLEDRVNLREDRAEAKVEISLGGGASLFGSGSSLRVRYPRDEATGFANLAAVNRDERVFRAGVRFPLSGGLELGLGGEYSEADFEDELADRSNSGLSPILTLASSGGELYVSALLALRSLEPEEGSSFVDYEDVTGSLDLSWRTRGRFELQLFADRNLVYSFDEEWASFEDASFGLGLWISLGSRASIRLFATQGVNDYAPVGPLARDREDDYDSLGADLSFRFGGATLLLGWSRTEYTSDLPDFDRTVTTVNSRLVFGNRRGGSPWG